MYVHSRTTDYLSSSPVILGVTSFSFGLLISHTLPTSSLRLSPLFTFLYLLALRPCRSPLLVAPLFFPPYICLSIAGPSSPCPAALPFLSRIPVPISPPIFFLVLPSSCNPILSFLLNSSHSETPHRVVPHPPTNNKHHIQRSPPLRY